jgi:peroxiredoxin
VIIDATCSSGRVSRVWIRSIENVDLAYQPSPLDFAVSVPAGTVVLDYREDQAHPKQGMTRYTVPDLITFANGLTSRNRSIDPVLKPGQPAPAIRPTSWLDQNGMITPPDLAGKVVLIDFWGIGCGPCVAELPEVQTAYDHLNSRNHDFMMIGLHDSGATVEQVAKFAVKRGLTYPIAIDRPTGETGWFGATFKEYGVRAIPAAAVIDRQGKITFVGRFNEALQKAADLLSR